MRGRVRPDVVVVAAVVFGVLIAQVAIAGSSGDGPRVTVSATLSKKVKRLGQRLDALEGKPAQPPAGAAGGDLSGSYPAPTLRTPDAPTLAGLDDLSGGCPGSPNLWFDSAPVAVLNEVGYYRDRQGRVYLQGNPAMCGNPGPAIFTLPAGFRPAKSEVQATVNDNAQMVTIVVTAAGSVEVATGVANGEFARLDGLSFRCGPSGQDGCP